MALPAVAGAQAGTAVPRVLELPASTRAMALGDAYMMNARHADALFYHPALLTDAGGFGLDVQRWGTAGTASAASAAMEWFGGGVGVGLLTLQSGGEADLFDPSSSPASERVAVVGYARELFGLSVGVAGKWVEARSGGARDAAALVDVSVGTEVGPLRAALTAQNLGGVITLDRVRRERPDRVRFGLGAYGQPVGPLDLGATLSAVYDGEGVTPALGLEVGYWPVVGRTFVARVGLRDPEGDAESPLSVGFAYWGDNLVLEWAFQPVDEAAASGTHRFGVRWR